MGLLNLTLAQLLAIFLPLSGLLIALYFYDRSRRRVVVSTLRFWPQRPAPPLTRRHKKLQQPWSLLLQILAALLLLLAVADLRFGLTDGTPRHHVLILDASSASASDLGAGEGRLIDRIRQDAERYLRALPSGDRTMLIRAAGLPSAATSFTDDREALLDAVRETQPGWTALDLDAAFELAAGSFRLALGEAAAAEGEVAYIGGDRLAGETLGAVQPAHLRWIDPGRPGGDLAVRRFSASRSADDPTRWEVALELWNDGEQARSTTVSFFFDGRKLGDRTLAASALGSADIDFRIRTEQAGRLEARIDSPDANLANNQAALELPAVVRRPLDVRTSRPQRLRTLLTAAPNLDVRFGGESRTNALSLIDGDQPGPRRAAIYLRPSAATSPITVLRTVRDARIVNWNNNHPLGAGLRDTDIRLASATILSPEPGDEVIAETANGPVVVARESAKERWVVIGFDPLEAGLANRLAGPLLFANAVRWFAPEVFRLAEFRAASPGSVEIDAAPATREQIHVETLSGEGPAWVYQEGRVRLFSPRPTVTRVTTPYSSTRLALELPEVAPARWTPPADVLRGVPLPAASGLQSGSPLWPWLAVAALALLALDWSLFARGPRNAQAAPPAPPSAPATSVLNLKTAPRPRREEALR